MPAAYTHYRFGNFVIEQLKDPLKSIILNNREYFDIGLHGPDILFYNRPYIHSKINRLGSAMHKQTASSFFYQAIDTLKQNNNEAQFAYLCGYVCHFIVDSNCHPLINKMMLETGVTHFEIETELDRNFMIRDHLDPLRTPLTNHIHINDKIINNILPYFNITKKDLIKSLRGIKFYDRLLLAPQLSKRALIYFVLGITFTYKRFQGFVVNYKPNEKIAPYLLQLESLFNQSIPEAIQAILNFTDVIKYNCKLSSRYDRNFK